jgi:hypothetical protein
VIECHDSGVIVYGLDDRGSIPGRGSDFSGRTVSRPSLEPTLLPICGIRLRFPWG